MCYHAYYKCAFLWVLLTSNAHCKHIAYLSVTTPYVNSVILSRSKMQRKKERGTMLGAQEQRSEVARLLSQISAEYEAAQRGLTGLAYGTSQHDFITARMENMGQLHGELQLLVGDIAIAMIAEQLNSAH